MFFENSVSKLLVKTVLRIFSCSTDISQSLHGIQHGMEWNGTLE